MDYARRWRAYSGGGLMAAWFVACRFATDIQQCTAKRGVKHGPVAQARVMLQGRVNAVVLKRSYGLLNFLQEPGHLALPAIPIRRRTFHYDEFFMAERRRLHCRKAIQLGKVIPAE